MAWTFRFLATFPLLDSFEMLAAALVAIGCVGELVLLFQKTPLSEEELRRFEKKKHFRERGFVCMVAIGVTMELICLPMGLIDVATLHKQTTALESTNNSMSLKIEDARSNNLVLEHHVELLRSNNLALETNVLSLRLRLKPRTITPQQVTSFIFLTAKLVKIPIKICIGQEGEDTEMYALHVREMFNNAGFKADPTAGTGGITREPKRVIARPIGFNYEWPSLILVTYGTNSFNIPDQVMLERPPCEQTNGFTRPIIIKNDTNKFLGAMALIFQQIGIYVLLFYDDTWVKPGEFAILVPIKNN